MKSCGKVDVLLHSFLALAIYGTSGQLHGSVTLLSAKEPIYLGVDGPRGRPGPFGKKLKLMSRGRIEQPTADSLVIVTTTNYVVR